MCLAMPAEIVERLGDTHARVRLGGIEKTISLALTETAKAGDYVIVHAGFALGVLDIREAEKTLELFRAMQQGVMP